MGHTHYQDCKTDTPLAVVSRHLSRKVVSPKDALDDVGAGRIAAAALAARVQGRGTLKIWTSEHPHVYAEKGEAYKC